LSTGIESGWELNLGVEEVNRALKRAESVFQEKPRDQTKNPFSNWQRVNNVSFPTFDFF
jgi:hypothetical protein